MIFVIRLDSQCDSLEIIVIPLENAIDQEEKHFLPYHSTAACEAILSKNQGSYTHFFRCKIVLNFISFFKVNFYQVRISSTHRLIVC